jgi:hypothetical protein
MTDPTAKQLLSEPISLHIEGSSSTKPQAADMDLTISLMGQDIAMGVLADGKKAWVEYENAWYAVPQENMKALEPGDQARCRASGSPTWASTRRSGTSSGRWPAPGPSTASGLPPTRSGRQKIAGDVMKALEDLALYEAGDPETAQREGPRARTRRRSGAEQSLESVAVDLWSRPSRCACARPSSLSMNTKAWRRRGPRRHECRVALTMADPTSRSRSRRRLAKDFDTLMNNLVGGMMAGA